MKTSTLLLTILVGVAVATSDREYPTFRAGKEYHYELDSQALTGDPHLSTQFSGFRIKTQIRLQIHSGSRAVLKCDESKFYQLNDILRELPTEKIVENERWQPVEQDLQQLYSQCLRNQIEFEYQSGVVRRVQVEQDEQQWCSNLKKAVITLFNYDLSQQNQIADIEDPKLRDIVQQNRMSWSNNYDQVYRVMEESVDGECESLYVTQKPEEQSQYSENEQQMKVTKIRNYNNCRMRPAYEEGLLSSLVADSKTPRNLTGVRSYCHADATISGDRSDFVIRQVKQFSRQMYTPLAEENGEIASFSVQVLELKDVKDTVTVMQPLRKPRVLSEGLKIVLNKDDLQTDLRSSSSRNNQDNQNTIKQLLSEYNRQTTPFVTTPSLQTLNKLMYVLRECSSQDIISVLKELNQRQTPETKKQLKTLKDLLPTCGRPHILPVIREMIQSEICSPNEAATMFNMIALSLKPTVAAINYLLPSSELFRLPAVTKNCQLRQAILMCLGTFQHAMRQAQKEQPIPDSDYTSIMQKVQREIERYYKDSNNECDRVAVLKTIGNSGMPEYFKFISERLQDQECSDDVRMNAIFALRRMPREFSQKIRSFLLPVYLNQQNKQNVRCVTYLEIIKRQPDYAIVQQIVHSLMKEQSQKVGAFVYNHLNDIVDSSRMSYEQTRRYVLKTMKEAKPFITDRFYRTSYTVDYLAEQLGIGEYFDLFLTESPTTKYPSSIVAILGQTFNAIEKSVFEAGVDFTGVEDLLKRLFGHKEVLQQSQADEQLIDDVSEIIKDLIEQRYTEGQQKLEQLVRKFIERLGLNGQIHSNNNERLSAYIKVLQNELRFFRVEKSNMKDWIQEYSQQAFDYLRRLVQDLSKGMQPDYIQSMSTESAIVIPTQLGIPLYCNITYSHILRLQGNAQLSSASRGQYQFNADFKPSSVHRIEGTVGLQLPQLRSGVDVDIVLKLQSHNPVEVEYTSSNENSNVHIRHYMPQEQIEMIRFESVPKTYIHRFDTTLTQKLYDVREKEIENKKLARRVPFEFRYEVESCDMELQHSWILPAQIVSFTPIKPLNGRHMYSCQMKSSTTSNQRQYIDVNFQYQSTGEQQKQQKYSSNYRSSSRDQQNVDEQQLRGDVRTRVLTTSLQTKNTKQQVQLESQLTFAMDKDYKCQFTFQASNRNSETKFTSNVFVDLMKITQPKENETPGEKVVTCDVRYSRKNQEDCTCSFQVIAGDKGMSVEVPVEPLFNYKIRQFIDFLTTDKDQQQGEKDSSWYKFFEDEEQQQSGNRQINRVTTTLQKEEMNHAFKYTIDIKYNLPKQVEDLVRYVFETYYYLNERYVVRREQQQPSSQQQIQQGEFSIIARVVSRYEKLHLILRTEEEEFVFYIPVRYPSFLKRGLTMDSSLLQYVQNQQMQYRQGECVIEREELTTYDGQLIALPQTRDCEILLSELPKVFQVIMKQQQSQQKKTIRINILHHDFIELSVSDDYMGVQYKLSLNEQSIPLTEGQMQVRQIQENVQLRVQKQQEQVELNIPELRIRLVVAGQQQQIRIQSNSLNSGELRGVCGDYNGDVLRERIGAQQTLHYNDEDFVRSYSKC